MFHPYPTSVLLLHVDERGMTDSCPSNKMPYVRICRRRPCVWQVHEKKFCYFSSWSRMRTLQDSGFHRRWKFCLSSLCLVTAVFQQCWTSVFGCDDSLKGLVGILELWPAHLGKGQLGVSNYLLPFQWAKHFFTIPPFLSIPSLCPFSSSFSLFTILLLPVWS